MRPLIPLAFVMFLLTFSGSAPCEAPPFTTYVFEADPSLGIGSPVGWKVSEQQEGAMLAAVITKSDADDSEGFMVFFVPLAKDHPANDSKQFADLMIANLRQESLPGLRVTREYAHTDMPILHVSEMLVSLGTTAFLGRSWSALLQDESVKTGLFVMFYAPEGSFRTWNADGMLANVLSPALGLEVGAHATPSEVSESQGHLASPAVGLTGDIVAIHRSPSGERAVVSLDPASKGMSQVTELLSAPLLSPSVSSKASALALAIDGVSALVISPWPDVTKPSITLSMPTSGSEIHASHPTFSHDGKLVAARIKGLSMAGRVDSHDWSSGAYLGSFTAIASEVSIIAFDLADQKPTVSYISRDMLDMGGKVPLAPSFSPVHDRIAFVNYQTLMLMEGSSGRRIQEIDLRHAPPMDNSGLAWSPDGKRIAYFQRKENVGSDGTAQYFITLLDPERRTVSDHALPRQLRPATAGAIASSACLDFSPDGSHIVFCAEERDPSKSSIIEWYDSIAAQGKTPSTDIYVYDLRTDQVTQMTTDGRTFDPVWKGR